MAHVLSKTKFCDVVVRQRRGSPILGIAYKCGKRVCYQATWHVPPSVKKRALKMARACVKRKRK